MTKSPLKRIGLRVKLWKDSAKDTPSSYSPGVNGSKASLNVPKWIRSIGIRFQTVPYYYRIQVSDYGAYSLLAETCFEGQSYCDVRDLTGFEAGQYLVLKNSEGSNKFLITGVDGYRVYFNGKATMDFDENSVAEDLRWWTIAWGYCDNTVNYQLWGGSEAHFPLTTVYGQYFRVVSVSEYLISVSVFDLYEDTYFDLSNYIYGNVEINRSVDIVEANSPLTSCTVTFLNTDERFNRRNKNSPYIENGINYIDKPSRMTIEYIEYGPDWSIPTNDIGEPDYKLLCTFTTRNWTINKSNEVSTATVTGETLNRISTKVEVPVLEIATPVDIMRNWVLTEKWRESIQYNEGEYVRFPIAVLEDAINKVVTAYNENVGQGNFGNPVALYSDEGKRTTDDKSTGLLYDGFYGITSDGKFIYTSHEIEQNELGNPDSGLLLVRRGLNCIPLGEYDMWYYYSDDIDDITAGDLCYLDGIIWLHTAQQNVTYNVYKIDATTMSVIDKYSKKGGNGHYPIHAATDGTYLYVLYDGGSEGRTLYKIDPSNYSTIWSHSFTNAEKTKTNFPYSGMFIIGKSTLIILSKAYNDSSRETGEYYAVVFKLSDNLPHLTYVNSIKLNNDLYPNDSTLNNEMGYASVVVTNAGIIALTGPYRPSKIKKSYYNTPLWDARAGGFSNIGQIKYWLANGYIANNTPEYTHPDALKDCANFPLEEIYIDGEKLDNGYDEEGNPVNVSYNGHIKTTPDYQINLRTGEIIFLKPVLYRTNITANYDFKPSVSLFYTDSEPRWELCRLLSQSCGAISYVTETERVKITTVRNMEDVVLREVDQEVILRGLNIIHPSNPKFTINTVQVANAEHNYFYKENEDYEVKYDLGIYKIKNKTITGHVVVSYFEAKNGEIPVCNSEGLDNPILDISESWDFSECYNNIVVEGEKRFASNTPVIISQSFVVSPHMYTVDSKFSMIVQVNSEEQYNWDELKSEFDTNITKDTGEAGIVIKFDEPMIIGTTEWEVIEPNPSHIEYKIATSNQPAEFVKVVWDEPFLTPGGTHETTQYDVYLDNTSYWRVCTADDVGSPGWNPEWTSHKTGSYVIIKKFRPGNGSESTHVYAYAVHSVFYHIDSANRVIRGQMDYDDNPCPTASPDKTIKVRLEPVSANGSHLFPNPGIYDGVSIPEDMCLSISAVRFSSAGLSVDCYNFSETKEQFLRIRVIGYPANSMQIIKTHFEDRFRSDESIPSTSKMGERVLSIKNTFIQSRNIANYISATLLDWLKEPHSTIQMTLEFTPNIDLLDCVVINSSAGDFSTNELWLVTGLQHNINTGDELSTTTVNLISIPNSQSVSEIQSY